MKPQSAESFGLSERDVDEYGAQTVVVEPADVFDDSELELGFGLPDMAAISSVLKLLGVADNSPQLRSSEGRRGRRPLPAYSPSAGSGTDVMSSVVPGP